MSNYTQREWLTLCYKVNEVVVDSVKICFSRQARNTYVPEWYVAVLGYNLSVYHITGYTPEGNPISGNRAYQVTPPDWVYDEAQRAIAEHVERYEELLNIMFLDTPEKRAEHLANQLAGRETSLKNKEQEVLNTFISGWKGRIKRMCADSDYKDSGLSGYVTVKDRRLNFEYNRTRCDVWYNGTFLQMYASRESIDMEVNKWIQKVMA